MRFAAVCLAALALGLLQAAEDGEKRKAITYSVASIVNAASNRPGPLAPNTFVSIYGKELSYSTRALQSSDMGGGLLPNQLPNTGVTVLVNGIFANVFYVSPTQVNILLPSNLEPGPAWMVLTLDGRAGPKVEFTLQYAAPALFQRDDSTAIATAPDGTLYSAQRPARGGDWVTLYATGLGVTRPRPAYSEIPKEAAALVRAPEFIVQLDGQDVDASRIAYAGVAPGFAGLYQINLRLPDGTGANPEIRIGYRDQMSTVGVRLSVR